MQVVGEDALLQRASIRLWTLRAKLHFSRNVRSLGFWGPPQKVFFVGIGATYCVRKSQRQIGVISIGYGDGYPRPHAEAPSVSELQTPSGVSAA